MTIGSPLNYIPNSPDATNRMVVRRVPSRHYELNAWNLGDEVYHELEGIWFKKGPLGFDPLTVEGGSTALYRYRNVSADAKIAVEDQFLSCEGGVNITLTLPEGDDLMTGKFFKIKSRNPSREYAITLTTSMQSEAIDGQRQYVFNEPYAFVSVIFNGSNFEVF